jgi:hypothetical protein
MPIRDENRERQQFQRVAKLLVVLRQHLRATGVVQRLGACIIAIGLCAETRRVAQETHGGKH